MAKRCRFLEEAVEALGLDAEVIVGTGRVDRSHQLAGPARRRSSPAASPLPPATAECAAPLLAVGGRLVVSEPPGGADRWPAEPPGRAGSRAGRSGRPRGRRRGPGSGAGRSLPGAVPPPGGGSGQAPAVLRCSTWNTDGGGGRVFHVKHRQRFLRPNPCNQAGWPGDRAPTTWPPGAEPSSSASEPTATVQRTEDADARRGAAPDRTGGEAQGQPPEILSDARRDRCARTRQGLPVPAPSAPPAPAEAPLRSDRGARHPPSGPSRRGRPGRARRSAGDCRAPGHAVADRAARRGGGGAGCRGRTRPRAPSAARSPDHGRRQPEGRGGQDHHRGQPGCLPGRPRLPGPGRRPRSPGQRQHRPRHQHPGPPGVDVRRDPERRARSRTASRPPSVRNLFVAPASLDLAGAEIELVPAFSRELRLKQALDEVRDDYDFVLIDCPPSLGLLTVNGLAAATEVLVPDPVRVLRPRGPGPAAAQRRPRAEEPEPDARGQHHRAGHVRRPHQAVRPGGARGPGALRRQGVPQRRSPARSACRRRRRSGSRSSRSIRPPGAPSPTGSWPRRSAVARRSGLGKGLGALIPDRRRRRTPTPALARAAGQPDRAQPAPAPRALRRGGAGRADRLDPRARRAPADPGAAGRRRPLRADRGRAALAGGQAGRPARRSRPSCARSTRRRSLEQALVENLHREDLNPLEEAAAYQQLIEDFDLTHEEVAQRVGKSRSAVANTLRLFQLPPTIQKLVADGQLTAGHARALLGTPDRAFQEALARRAVAERPLGPRGRGGGAGPQRRGRAASRRPTSAARRAAAPAGRRLRPPGLLELEELLSDRLDTRVKVTMGAKRGKVVIEFATLEDLERIYRAMTAADVASDRLTRGTLDRTSGSAAFIHSVCAACGQPVASRLRPSTPQVDVVHDLCDERVVEQPGPQVRGPRHRMRPGRPRRGRPSDGGTARRGGEPIRGSR